MNFTSELFQLVVSHSVAIGLSLWQANIFAVIIIWFHLIFIGLLFFARIKEKAPLVKVAHSGAVLINVMLLFNGLSNL